ncbi:MAG: ribosomal-protein-alanine N-acetyltransferase [Steroidobacteraceae bacterium]
MQRIERESYRFPWTEGIFHDCLRVGYTCIVAEIDVLLAGYGVLSAGAGEAHLLNLCVAEAALPRPGAPAAARAAGARARRRGERGLPRGASVEHLRDPPLPGPRFVQIGVRRGYYQAAGGREDASYCASLSTHGP